MQKQTQMQARRLADVAWQDRPRHHSARLVKDGETGAEVILVRCPAGNVTPDHTHPCAHGLPVIKGRLIAQSGSRGNWCRGCGMVSRRVGRQPLHYGRRTVDGAAVHQQGICHRHGAKVKRAIKRAGPGCTATCRVCAGGTQWNRWKNRMAGTCAVPCDFAPMASPPSPRYVLGVVVRRAQIRPLGWRSMPRPDRSHYCQQR